MLRKGPENRRLPNRQANDISKRNFTTLGSM